MRVSVICTVLNEAQAVGQLLDSLARQSRPPDEVVLVDGGSRDGTLAAAAAYADRLPLVIHQEPGANISRGRNLAVSLTTGDVIASTDAGVRLPVNWLERLVEPLAGRSSEELRSGRFAVAGFFEADPHTVFELALGATTLPMVDEIKPAQFLPSSRSVAWSRGAWPCSRGYPEWLDYCEDLLFDFALRECCGQFAWAPDARVYFRPRPTLRSFFKQYYRYARGDGKADLWRKRHAIRYGTYLVALPAVTTLALARRAGWWLALLAGAAAYLRRPVQRLTRQWHGYGWPQRMEALALLPLLRLVGDVAKMIGYPVGLLWRWRHRTEVNSK